MRQLVSVSRLNERKSHFPLAVSAPRELMTSSSTLIALQALFRIERPATDEGAVGVNARTGQQPLFGLLIPLVVVLQSIHALEVVQRAAGGNAPDALFVTEVVSELVQPRLDRGRIGPVERISLLCRPPRRLLCRPPRRLLCRPLRRRVLRIFGAKYLEEPTAQRGRAARRHRLNRRHGRGCPLGRGLRCRGGGLPLAEHAAAVGRPACRRRGGDRQRKVPRRGRGRARGGCGRRALRQPHCHADERDQRDGGERDGAHRKLSNRERLRLGFRIHVRVKRHDISSGMTKAPRSDPPQCVCEPAHAEKDDCEQRQREQVDRDAGGENGRRRHRDRARSRPCIGRWRSLAVVSPTLMRPASPCTRMVARNRRSDCGVDPCAYVNTFTAFLQRRTPPHPLSLA